ncbi:MULTISPECIES: oligoendopeptidase F [Enterocloster]|uniref:Oligopeptidase F n=1 Tax=Enterocloster lavalensis TaxID=460384 RepID=A0A1I0HKY7_9FIRM|nr:MULTISPECIES: oligoendopeptidase F [Enterocloster]MDR3759225.1 oligoendopeptidase F [Enterocloster sp.]PST33764.1 oligoendopeptidase F [Enterocloster lavalensis]SET84550.1 oligoendopeptidase F [Enterocloster lavalensis]
MKKRSEADISYTWKLEDMMPDNQTWEALFEKTAAQVKRYGDFKDTLAESAETLYRCLKFDDEISLDIERLYVYARMRSDEDTAEQSYQDMFGRAQSLSFEAAERSSFIVPEILEMDPSLLASYMESENGIGLYRRLMERILGKREHTLSGPMEELLAQSYDATQGASQIFNMFNNADVKFPSITGEHGQEVPITHGNYISLMEHKDRRIRRDAFLGLYSVYRQFRNTLAAAFSANVKQAVFYAKARNYASSRQHSLAENEVPELVYDNLVAAVRKNLPLLHRYVRVRKETLGLDDIHMYDLYVPMVAEFDRTYTYEEAKAIVTEGLAPLGEEYGKILREGFENRWVDVYENEGKRSGAYSWGVYGSHPYVLMNFHGTLNDVFTLAHEMGHSIHSYYSDAAQPYIYAGYKIFVAEVASTCNEALLIRHLLNRTEETQEKRYLINHFLESFRGTLFRQTMFAEFEAAAHRKAQEGETLTASALGELYHKLNEDYFGPEMVVDPEIDYEWERIPHFYTPFYVYQYATGFSAAVAISSRILSGDETALAGYKKFLQGGCSLPPIDLLKLCGVDMSTTKPVDEALKVFGELLEEFCRL